MRIAYPIEVTVQRICSSPAPVLFVDTCAVLDIIRAPVRSEVPNAVISAAGELLRQSLASPPGVWLIVGPEVPEEFARNLSSAKDTLDNRVRDIETGGKKLAAAHSLLEIPSSISIHPASGPSLVTSLVTLAQNLLDAALLLQADPGCKETAIARYCLRIPPGNRGSEFTDCLIFEHYILAARLLRKAGLTTRMAFVSANTKDYCDGGEPKPEIAADLQSVNLEFTRHLEWARGYLTEKHTEAAN